MEAQLNIGIDYSHYDRKATFCVSKGKDITFRIIHIGSIQLNKHEDLTIFADAIGKKFNANVYIDRWFLA